METTFKINDPAKARAYFETKLAFSTGPVELDRGLRAGTKLTVVDVRTAEDYAKGHIPDAINLPREKWAQAEGLARDHLNVVYCYSQACHLAAKAALEFATRGYPVMELDGGFQGWKDCDLSIERAPVNRLKKGASLGFHRHVRG